MEDNLFYLIYKIFLREEKKAEQKTKYSHNFTNHVSVMLSK